MKTLFKLIILFGFILFASRIEAQNKFVISGKLPSNHDEVEAILLLGTFPFSRLAATSQNGKFQFSGNLKDEFEGACLTIKAKDGHFLGSNTFFLKAGNMEIIIEQFAGSNDKRFNAKYFNVPFLKEQKEYADLMKPIEDNMDSLSKLMLIKKEIKKNDQDSLQSLYNIRKKERVNTILEFVTKKQSNYLGLYILNSEIIERLISKDIHPDTLLSIYNGFDRYLKSTNLGKTIYSNITKRQSLLVGRTMPNFSFLTYDGRQCELSSFQGNKYVLLCFWSSGCAPCIKSIPILKELAKEFETKGLQLISVSDDRDELTWLNSLKRYDLTWLQTCDLPKFNKGISISSLYDVKYIPQYFLLDIEGKLIYHNNQLRDTEDYALLKMKLKEIFD